MLLSNFSNNVIKFPNKIMIKTYDRELSYKEVDDITNNIASNLCKYKRVANYLKDGLNLLLTNIALAKCRTIFVNLNTEGKLHRPNHHRLRIFRHLHGAIHR